MITQIPKRIAILFKLRQYFSPGTLVKLLVADFDSLKGVHFLGRKFQSDGNITLKTRASSLITLTGRDFGTLIQIFCDDEYEKLHQITDGCRGLRVADLGANIGMFSLWLFLSGKPSEIVCVEPMPQNFELLKLNTSNLNVDLRNFGVSNEENEFYVSFNGPGTTIFPNSTSQSKEKSVQSDLNRIQIVDIFEHFGEHPFDVIKMDIEGAEGPIFADSRFPNFVKNTKAIVLEWHTKCPYPQTNHEEWFKKRLEECGFEVSRIFARENQGVLIGFRSIK